MPCLHLKALGTPSVQQKPITEINVMPAVLVHGIPDTYRVWNRVRSHLKRGDVIALEFPVSASRFLRV